MKNKPLLSFKEIYFECNVKPLFERILREMSQEPVNDDDGINGYGNERLGQYKDPRFNGTLNNPNQSEENFRKDVEGEVRLAKVRDGKFNIIRVFDNNEEKNIGYITYSKEISDLILNVTVFRTAEAFIKKKGGVSVIDEMEQFIIDSFKNGIETIHWTCFANNPIKEVYDRRFSKYNPDVSTVYDENSKQNIVTYLLNKANLPTN
jgi:hypothetical protein